MSSNPSACQVSLLALGMLAAGSINTIAYKVADWQHAPGVYDISQCTWNATAVPSSHDSCSFTHPFFQVLAMFLGEALCLPAFFTLRAFGSQPAPKPFNWFIFLPCALCDMCGTSLMLLGLLLTFMSNFQMLRGSVVLFTGVFSRIFLKRKLTANHRAGMVLVFAGTAVVGLDSLVNGTSTASASNPVLGNLLITLAQVIVAIQFVLEEKLVSSKDVPPLLAVGLEGVFGFLVLSCALVGFYYIPGVSGLSETPVRLEDPFDALKQLDGSNPLLVGAMCAAVLSIAFYNFFGISVTKQLSAAHRMVMDCTRTVIVWVFSMSVYYAGGKHSGHGQPFSSLQLLGFLILVLGSMVYYDVAQALVHMLCGRRTSTGSAARGEDPLLVNVVSHEG